MLVKIEQEGGVKSIKIAEASDGLNAYQLAVKNDGFVGDYNAWKVTLKGDEGKGAFEVWEVSNPGGTLEQYNAFIKGEAGYTPIKGTDYFDGTPFVYEDLTQAQKDELKIATSGEVALGNLDAVSGDKVAKVTNNKADLVAGKNKFNKSKAKIGFYTNEQGSVISSPTYDTSDFIPVIIGENYISNYNMRFTCYYDSSFNVITGGNSSAKNTFVPPSGSSFVKVTVYHTDLDVFQLETGTESSIFESYKLVISENQGSDILKSLGEITENWYRLNIFNKNSFLVQADKYVVSTNGTFQTNTSFTATGLIKIPENTSNLYLSISHQIAFYDINKVFISGNAANYLVDDTVVVPNGAKFVACSVPDSSGGVDNFMIGVGSKILTYKDYRPPYKDLKNQILLKSNIIDDTNTEQGKIYSKSSINNGSIIELSDFPFHLKKGISMSFYADLTSFSGSVSYGKGFGKYRGERLSINTTTIAYYYDGVLQSSTPHGLTIETFLKSSFYTDDNGIAHILLQSLNGTFQTSLQWNYRMNYEPFLKTDGQDLTNVRLTCTSKEFQHNVWAFGDSYFGIEDIRWVGQMKNFGYFNFLINGLAGQVSAAAYDDLLRCLKYGTPKYLIWALGMNDTDTNYQTYLDLVISKCLDLGITLILATAPTVPTRDKEVIKGIVESSGCRYVDFYKSVGADNLGNWYAGYLNADGVHPNLIGAQALASQVLVDFPELMQYGKTF